MVPRHLSEIAAGLHGVGRAHWLRPTLDMCPVELFRQVWNCVPENLPRMNQNHEPETAGIEETRLVDGAFSNVLTPHSRPPDHPGAARKLRVRVR